MGYDNAEANHILNDCSKLDKTPEPLELSCPNGSVIHSNYRIVETIIYGHYLHADIDKIESLIGLPIETLALFATPYVLDREDLLYRTTKLFMADFSKTSLKKIEAAGIIKPDQKTTETRSINKSPYWKNAYGKDATEKEAIDIFNKNTYEENNLISMAVDFVNELRKQEFNLNILRSLTWEDTWAKWGDFTQAHKIIASIPNPGYSSKVHQDNQGNYAQVKVLSHVTDFWITKTKQYLLDKTYLITFAKRNNEWKITRLEH